MYRHEMKYVLDPRTAHVISQKLKQLCVYDANADEKGFYRVTSLYFDDFTNSALNDNIIGQMMRKKYRIRIYDGNDALIRLEKKIKHNQVGMKESVALTRNQYEMILEGNYQDLMKEASPLLKAFCIESISRLLRPRVIVEYDRQTFVYDHGSVRITFDHRIRHPLNGLDLFDQEKIMVPVTEGGQVIMEVKYTGFLPAHIRDMVQQSVSTRQSVSKYTLCRTSGI